MLKLKNGCLVIHYGYLEGKKGEFCLRTRGNEKYSSK
jgi:hypothetical protein